MAEGIYDPFDAPPDHMRPRDHPPPQKKEVVQTSNNRFTVYRETLLILFEWMIPTLIFYLLAYMGLEGCKYKKWERTLKRKIACLTGDYALSVAFHLTLITIIFFLSIAGFDPGYFL